MNVLDFKRKKQNQTKICMLTCYDYPSACIAAESNIDCFLVGDSVAMAVHGYDTTVMATIEMMVLHTQAVARGLKNHFLITDLPFLSHKGSRTQTISNVKKLMRAGAHAIKIEGGDDDTCQTISYLVNAGIPIMGHIGLTPQSVHQLGGYKIQGKSKDQEAILMQQAVALEQAGCFAIVIECVPQNLAKTVTNSLTIPTIGIGAGPDTNGQVLVWHDMLGLQMDFNPKFVKKFAQGKDFFLTALNAYATQVHQCDFPTPEHSY
jgi:3-methyl-2-oxobutanoate hydroxymethyltransferase